MLDDIAAVLHHTVTLRCNEATLRRDKAALQRDMVTLSRDGMTMSDDKATLRHRNVSLRHDMMALSYRKVALRIHTPICDAAVIHGAVLLPRRYCAQSCGLLHFLRAAYWLPASASIHARFRKRPLDFGLLSARTISFKV